MRGPQIPRARPRAHSPISVSTMKFQPLPSLFPRLTAADHPVASVQIRKVLTFAIHPDCSVRWIIHSARPAPLSLDTGHNFCSPSQITYRQSPRNFALKMLSSPHENNTWPREPPPPKFLRLHSSAAASFGLTVRHRQGRQRPVFLPSPSLTPFRQTGPDALPRVAVPGGFG